MARNEEEDALYLISELAKRGIAYLHMCPSRTGRAANLTVKLSVRKSATASRGDHWRWRSHSRKANDLINKGLIDAVAFGRDYIANPDLGGSSAEKAPLNPQRPESFYGGDAEGYTDYPTL